MHVWTQWGDLDLPAGVHLHHDALDDTVRDLIEFYVPRYTGAALDADMARMPNLKVLQVPNAGYEDVLHLAREGLTICNARGVHDASTAELAIGLVISALRGMPDDVRAQDQGRWQHTRRQALADKRVAVIGHGSIGRRITMLLRALEAEVQPYSRSGSDQARTIDSLDAQIAGYDVIVLIAPANAGTRHLMSRARIDAMKPGALLVNVARGSLVDTEALVDALTRGHIRAAVDVTDPEPLPEGHPLWSAPGVLITPHVGGDTSAFEPRMRRLITEQVTRALEGRPLLNVVSP